MTANIDKVIRDMYEKRVDYLREKRKLEVKAIISKIPIKISIISVFFFVPLVLLIILAPAVLGFFAQEPEKFTQEMREKYLNKIGLEVNYITNEISRRAGAKKEKNFVIKKEIF